MNSNEQVKRSDGADVFRGLAAGLIGGLVASWTMNQFQVLWSKVSEEIEKSQDGPSAPQGEQGGAVAG